MTVHRLSVPDYEQLKTAKYMTPCHHPKAREEQHEPGYMLGTRGLVCRLCIQRIKVDRGPGAGTNTSKKQPAGVRSIAVVWGDNDFHNTFVPLLETLRRAVRYRSEALTPDAIKGLLRDGLWFHYLAFQGEAFRPQAINRYKIPPPGDPTRLAQTMKYLSRDFLSVKFNEEADLAVGTEDHNHSAWYVRFDDDNPVLSF